MYKTPRYISHLKKLDFPPPSVSDVIPFDEKASRALEAALNAFSPRRLTHGLLPVAYDAAFNDAEAMDISDASDAPAADLLRSTRESSAASERRPPVDKGKARARSPGKSSLLTCLL